MTRVNHRPILDTGIGLRTPHYRYILDERPDVPWFEALSDNYFNDAAQLNALLAVREHYPVTLHGVGMSLGSIDPLNFSYLSQLKQLAEKVQPGFISDHLSWSSVNNQYLHDLLPLPFTQESICHVSDRIQQVQDFLGRRILIENPSSYFRYQYDEMTEWEFINAVAEKADCYILLDINNIYVTAFNHGFDAYHYLENIVIHRVKQFHMAGYSDENTYLFDMHNQAIHEPVWLLYQAAIKRFGAIPTLIERDDNIPSFDELYAESKKATQLMREILTHETHIT